METIKTSNFYLQTFFRKTILNPSKREGIQRSGLNGPSTDNVGKLFFGQDYENNVYTKFSINLGARWGFLLLLFHPSATFILGPPKQQKFRHFPSFCQNAGKFVNSSWMKKKKVISLVDSIKSNYQTHNSKLPNLHREGKKKGNQSEIRNFGQKIAKNRKK